MLENFSVLKISSIPGDLVTLLMPINPEDFTESLTSFHRFYVDPQINQHVPVGINDQVRFIVLYNNTCKSIH